MAKILYSARLENGTEKAGYIEASSEQDAIEQLKAKGLTDIHLLETIAQARLRVDRNKFIKKESEKRAKFEAKAMKNPSFKGFFLETLRTNMVIWTLCSVVLVMSLDSFNNKWFIGFAIIYFIAIVGVPFFAYRNISRFNKLLEAYAIGDWTTVRRLAALLSSTLKKKPLDLWGVTVKCAYADAAEGNLQQGLNRLERVRTKMLTIAPELVENQTAIIYHAAKDYPQFIKKMRQACSISSNPSSIYLADLLMAEARLGNPDEAEKILNQIDPTHLPILGSSFLDWGKGIIALRRNLPNALEPLQQAIQGFTTYNKNPAIWTATAMCSGHYALALARADQQAEAVSVLKEVWPILKIHADTLLLSMLKREVPEFFTG